MRCEVRTKVMFDFLSSSILGMAAPVYAKSIKLNIFECFAHFLQGPNDVPFLGSQNW